MVFCSRGWGRVIFCYGRVKTEDLDNANPAMICIQKNHIDGPEKTVNNVSRTITLTKRIVKRIKHVSEVFKWYELWLHFLANSNLNG